MDCFFLALEEGGGGGERVSRYSHFNGRRHEKKEEHGAFPTTCRLVGKRKKGEGEKKGGGKHVHAATKDSLVKREKTSS